MSTDTGAADSTVAERLLAAVETHLDENSDAPVSDVRLGDATDYGPTIVVPGLGGGDVVVVARNATEPMPPDAIASARDAGETTAAVATWDGTDLFFFDVRSGEAGEIDYYLDARDRALSDAVAALLETVVHLDCEGRFPRQPPRTRLRGALRSALDGASPALEAAARDAYGSDPAFTEAFDEWVDSNDGGSDRAFSIAATQYATLFLQWVLRDEIGRRSGAGATETAPSDDRLRDAVSAIGRRDDGSAATTLFDRFPHDESTRQCLLRGIRTIERAPTAEGHGCTVGDVYEEYIPASERSNRGQFYTDPSIAAALVRWALGADANGGVDRPPQVLDPAAGSGIFAAEAYRALADRYPDASDAELLDRIHAVDVERFPLRLTEMNLGGPRVDGRVNTYHGSFFDVAPDNDLADCARVEVLGDAEGGAIERVDAVVGNPPYVEASDLAPDREHYRAHLQELGPDDAAPYADGSDAIGANADAYVYFATHATRFLRDGGRLAFVVPTKWMMSQYGEQFQGFVHDHYRIEAVVGFDARAFEDALVDAALVLLEKCADERERRENVVRFVQLRDAVSPDTLLGAIDRDLAATPDDQPAIAHKGDARIVGVDQSTLAAGTGKLTHYLVAPADLIELLDSDELTHLGDLADVSRGAMTGSTAFFFPEAADVRAHGIEDEFLRPALKSMRGHETIAYEPADVDRWFVDVHEYVEAVRERAGSDGGDLHLEERVKKSLAENGSDGLLSWIRRAEDEGAHRGATCERREVWFDFGEPPRPDVLFQKLLRERLFCIYNRADAVPSNAVDCIDVHADVDSKALFGALNSSLVRAIMEVWGRNEAGMLQLMTYETESLPVPDVRGMSAAERDRIAGVVNEILDRGASEFSDADRDRLDAAVLDALGSVDASATRIQAIQRRLLQRRVGTGDTAEVLVNASPDE